MIIEQAYNFIRERYSDGIGNLTLSEVRIGPYLTAVRLSDASVGTSATITGEQQFCAKSSRDFGDFTPLRIRGCSVLDLIDSKKDTGIMMSLRVAVLNAISSRFISSGSYLIDENRDPIQYVDLDSRKTITIVGAFHSYIRKVSVTGNRLFVLEMNEKTLEPDFKKFYVPAADFRNILPDSDIVIITGQTLVNGTIDRLIESISPGTQVIVTGPSSSIVPDVLFANKVSIIGAVRITDPERMFDIVSEGGTGYHLYEYCAMKICIVRGDEAQVK